MRIAKPERKLPISRIKIFKCGIYVAILLAALIIILNYSKIVSVIDNKNSAAVAIENDFNSKIASHSVSINNSKVVEEKDSKLYFNKYLKSLSEVEEEKLELVNNMLFNMVGHPSNEEFEILLLQGYPSKAELNFVLSNQFNELSIILLNNKMENYPISSEFQVNINSLRVLNFVNTVAEIEKVISYYHTDFKFSSGKNPNTAWMDGSDKMPSQIKEALESLIYAQAALSTETGLELLAKAKFEEMMSYWNNENTRDNINFFRHLSEASKKLPFLGIDDYVKSEFPENYEGYLDLKKNNND